MSENTLPLVTVIIPTIASKKKELLLKRAIDSIRCSSASSIQIIAVVNGPWADPGVCEWLHSMSDVQYERTAVGSLPKALLRGRELVTTPYFSFLDDDDEYLAGATDRKLAALENHPTATLVVSSGFRCIDEVDSPVMTQISAVLADPLRSLFDVNWLSSCNVLFRSASVHPEFFKDSHPYAEWTWLAYKLACSGAQIVAIDEPTFRIHDTPGSVSKSQSYHDAYQSLYLRMLHCKPPKSIISIIKARLGADWHDRSVRALARGDRRTAVVCHLRSMMLPTGFKYTSYTRHLLLDWSKR